MRSQRLLGHFVRPAARLNYSVIERFEIDYLKVEFDRTECLFVEFDYLETLVVECHYFVVQAEYFGYFVGCLNNCTVVPVAYHLILKQCLFVRLEPRLVWVQYNS